ncbi:MAG TPA: protein kinase [Methylomirabilota bacterium]|jgi:serine/threonine-protein kinase|nr:protein kinase [Methylomirabilota bacterium]
MRATSDRCIGRYEILTELGRGAMGVVYKARDPQLDRLVAIKTVRHEEGLPRELHADVRNRLHQEATAIARLSHPNIVAVHDVVYAGDTPCIVMEYFEGRPLADLIVTGPLPAQRAAQVVLQICEALDYAHASGVVHRDIKAHNILVAENWLAKLSDFSIARIAGKNATHAGAMVGTPAYMAPELVRGHPADARSDLFSLGVVLYEMVVGARPFDGHDVATVLYEITHVDPAPPRARNPELSSTLDGVIRRVMSKLPEHRYPNARAFATALGQATGSTDEGRVKREALPPKRRMAGRRSVLIGTSCLALAALATWTLGGASGRHAAIPQPAPPNERGGPSPLSIESTAASAGPGVGESTPATVLSDPELTLATKAPGSKRAVALRPEVIPSGHPSGCLSVNAIPFASVHVDGRHIGDTPKACLRVRTGEHRIQFQGNEGRSPTRVIQVLERHTAEDPLQLSYDFRSRRFLER